MYENDNRDPDAILLALNAENEKKNRAQLRIFLGMSAGVGKTFAMLNVAHKRLAEGVDVIIGVVETHGRSETAALLDGLPILPLKKIKYRGTSIEEFDIDGILQRKPQLVIVDELAHTNVPGSRHPKRYQDVLELLDAGIDVYTALNVQHLESRKDSVEAITGIIIRETVPDSILDRATLVEVVDIAPTELLKRLQEGKIYLGDKAVRAADNFFKEDKLTALREIALRMTAERVDQELQQFSKMSPDFGSWQTNERLLVAISHSPYSEKLIRSTRRLAYNLEAPWIALYVDTGVKLNNADQAQLVKNLNLARDLNAELITTTDVDIPSAIKRIAKQKNVRQVVVGRPTRRWISDFLSGGSLLDQIVHEILDVDVHVIRQTSFTRIKPTFFQILKKLSYRTGFIEYWNIFWFITALTFLSGILEPYIHYRSIGFFFLLGVFVVGIFSTLGPVIFAATLSSIVWDFFFIPPKLTFVIHAQEDLILCASFFLVALIMGVLTHRLRFHERLIREREAHTHVLYEILQDISNSTEKTEFITKIINRINGLMNANCGVILQNLEQKLNFQTQKNYSIYLNEKEQAVAQWAFENQKAAGWSTDTLPQSSFLYIPLIGKQEVVGVFVFQQLAQRKLDLDQENLLYSVIRQLALSLERHFLEKRIKEAQKLKESEELHQTLLNSVSHEMRTPLAALITSASSLLDEPINKNPESVQMIAKSLVSSGNRLNHVIENLLDMSRLSSGGLSLKLEWQDLHDLIGVCLKKLSDVLENFKVEINIDPKISLIRIDFRLFEHALSNIILNATLYSPKNTTIFIEATQTHTYTELKIIDQGKGIPEESIPFIFDKFYRTPGSPTGGTGLGLSIVKSIIELHKGSINAYNHSKGGACFVIQLPYIKPPTVPEEK